MTQLKSLIFKEALQIRKNKIKHPREKKKMIERDVHGTANSNGQLTLDKMLKLTSSQGNTN